MGLGKCSWEQEVGEEERRQWVLLEVLVPGGLQGRVVKHGGCQICLQKPPACLQSKCPPFPPREAKHPPEEAAREGKETRKEWKQQSLEISEQDWQGLLPDEGARYAWKPR